MNKNYKPYLYWNNDIHHHGYYCIETVCECNMEDYFVSTEYSGSIISKDFVNTSIFFPKYVYVCNIFILDRYDGKSLDKHENQKKYEYYI